MRRRGDHETAEVERLRELHLQVEYFVVLHHHGETERLVARMLEPNLVLPVQRERVEQERRLLSAAHVADVHDGSLRLVHHPHGPDRCVRRLQIHSQVMRDRRTFGGDVDDALDREVAFEGEAVGGLADGRDDLARGHLPGVFAVQGQARARRGRLDEERRLHRRNRLGLDVGP